MVIGPGDLAATRVFAEVADGRENWRSLPALRPSVVGALNLGLAEAKGDIIVLTDDDSEAPPFWLQRMERHYLADARVGAVGGRDRLVLPSHPWLENPPPAKCVGQFNWYGLMLGNHHCGAVNSPLEVDMLKGVNLSFRRAAFPAGKIDSYLVSYGAEVGWEVDISLSIRQAGWRIIYDNDIWLRHHVGQRTEGDGRNEMTSAPALRRAQNTSYLSAVYQPFWQVVMVELRAALVGARFQPGLIWGMRGALAGNPATLAAVLRLFGARCRGMADGRKARVKKFFKRGLSKARPPQA